MLCHRHSSRHTAEQRNRGQANIWGKGKGNNVFLLRCFSYGASTSTFRPLDSQKPRHPPAQSPAASASWPSCKSAQELAFQGFQNLLASDLQVDRRRSSAVRQIPYERKFSCLSLSPRTARRPAFREIWSLISPDQRVSTSISG